MTNEDGYLIAEFRWRNHHGYEYRVREADEGCWEIEYWEDESETCAGSLSFSAADAEGLIGIIRRTLDIHKENGRG